MATVTSLAALLAQQAALDVAKASAEAARLNVMQVTQQKSAEAARKSNEKVFNEMVAAQHPDWRIWKLEGFEKFLGQSVGSGQCPAIVQLYGGLPLVRHWRAGPKVRGNTMIPYGTAIATFVDGKYPNWAHGNHTAIYLEQDDKWGVHVFEQFSGHVAQKRWLPYLDEKGEKNRSNNGAAFSVILTPA